MLMNRALARMGLEPAHDAVEMEAAEALQAAHLITDLELLEADRTLGVVDAVLLAGVVGEEARAAGQRGGGGAAEDHGSVGLLAGGGAGCSGAGRRVEGGGGEGG